MPCLEGAGQPAHAAVILKSMANHVQDSDSEAAQSQQFETVGRQVQMVGLCFLSASLTNCTCSAQLLTVLDMSLASSLQKDGAAKEARFQRQYERLEEEYNSRKTGKAG